ncbi:cytochrome P450 [Choiromyces venosus 120613-1]|uniref:Cytochrome P450 n=1 Tax=Choiromyces venosus 120613-1 TaxID=1336337 RepID=A0A3N4JBX8_9PEZI|nr:cytochrome P450 [Choiromyces venosus 120613-1]
MAGSYYTCKFCSLFNFPSSPFNKMCIAGNCTEDPGGGGGSGTSPPASIRPLTIIISFLAVVIASYLFQQKRRRLPLPPGPRGVPIFGNLFQIARKYQWRQQQEWSQKYGPVFKMQLGTHTVIVLGTYQAARDLLDKRSKIYSDRPKFIVCAKHLSGGYRSLLMNGEIWNTHHRLQATVLSSRMSQKYRPVQDLESKHLIHALLKKPEDFSLQFHRYSASLIFAMGYGKRLITGQEKELQSIDAIMRNFTEAGAVGRWWVDMFPILDLLPKYFAEWKKISAEFHKFESELHVTNLNNARERKGWNWAKMYKNSPFSQGMSDLEVGYDLGTLYEAGSDTTTIALEIFLVAMIKFPHVARRAQEELDRVVGKSRLPSWQDKDSLPYIEKVVQETLRWRPVAVNAFYHAVTEDDEYLGYRIPKGAWVVGNSWGIHLDPEVYPNPNDFNPDRFDDETLGHVAFGFGRRACPGKYIAKNSLFINISRLLWSFDIGPKIRPDGTEVLVDDMAFTNGFLSQPLPFECSIKPRDQGRVEVIEREWAEANKDLLSLVAEERFT